MRCSVRVRRYRHHGSIAAVQAAVSHTARVGHAALTLYGMVWYAGWICRYGCRMVAKQRWMQAVVRFRMQLVCPVACVTSYTPFGCTCSRLGLLHTPLARRGQCMCQQWLWVVPAGCGLCVMGCVCMLFLRPLCIDQPTCGPCFCLAIWLVFSSLDCKNLDCDTRCMYVAVVLADQHCYGLQLTDQLEGRSVAWGPQRSSGGYA